MTDNNEKPNQNTSLQNEEPGFLKLLNSKPSNRKVGQVFITSTMMLPAEAEQQKEYSPTLKREPKYLKALGGTWSNDKVGQTFIISTKMQHPIAAPSEQNLSPLMEKTILDIMNEYKVDRQKAINILNQPL